MRILVVHNRSTRLGGEDAVVDEEVAALRMRGHVVETVLAANPDPDGGVLERARVATRAVHSRRAAADLAEVVTGFQADVVHVHNHAYQLSASIFPAIRATGVPVVQTLHNYQMTCSSSYLLRENRPCELCVGTRAAWQGVRHKCFRGSRAGSLMLAGMQLAYRRSAIPNIDRWIVLTQFARAIFERAEFPRERLVVKPNTVRDPGRPIIQRAPDAPIVFIGRLEQAKGIDTLLNAWSTGVGSAQLLVIGDGPLRAQLQQQAPPNVVFLGLQRREHVSEILRTARALVVPSTWYEGFPMVVLEAFAAGTPVIASDLGALAEIVPSPSCGWRVPPGYVDGLRAAMTQALSDPIGSQQRGATARLLYEQRYSPAIVTNELEAIYAQVIAR